MITPDPTSPALAAGSTDDVDALLEALRSGGTAAGAGALPAEFVSTLTAILGAPGGSLDVVLSFPQGYSTHRFTLARAGVLRRSRGLTAQEEIALHPVTVLPGALLRLVGIAPVEALDAATVLEVPRDAADGLFDADAGARTAAWRAVTAASAALPTAAKEDLDSAPPRAARVTRHRPEGSRSATVLLLRGRYLVLSPEDPGSLVGTTPTGAARAVTSTLLSADG